MIGSIKETTNQVSGQVNKSPPKERLEPLEKISFTARAALSALSDPYLRGDMVAAVGETTGEIALERLLQKMKSNSQGQEILKHRPVMTKETVDMKGLMALSPDTVGGAFARYHFMHGFTLGERTPVKYIEDEELSYVMRRYREIHDILHILIGFPVSVAGEVALKWFELVQTGLPMTALAAFFGPLRAETELKPYLNAYIESAILSARESELFMNFYIEQSWEQKLRDFRMENSIKPLDSSLASLDCAWNGNQKLLIDHYESARKALGEGK